MNGHENGPGPQGAEFSHDKLTTPEREHELTMGDLMWHLNGPSGELMNLNTEHTKLGGQPLGHADMTPAEADLARRIADAEQREALFSKLFASAMTYLFDSPGGVPRGNPERVATAASGMSVEQAITALDRMLEPSTMPAPGRSNLQEIHQLRDWLQQMADEPPADLPPHPPRTFIELSRVQSIKD